MSLPPRSSACSELTTEDNRTPIVEGMRLFNYYDGRWGYVYDIREDGWFRLYSGPDRQGSYDLLNGVRVSTVEPPRRRPRA